MLMWWPSQWVKSNAVLQITTFAVGIYAETAAKPLASSKKNKKTAFVFSSGHQEEPLPWTISSPQHPDQYSFRNDLITSAGLP